MGRTTNPTAAARSSLGSWTATSSATRPWPWSPMAAGASAAPVDLDLPREGATLGELLELVASLQQAAADRGIPALVVFSGRRGFHLMVPTGATVAWSVMLRALRRI